VDSSCEEGRRNMAESSFLRLLKERQSVQWALVFILVWAVVLFVPPLAKGILAVALGVLGLISSLRLRLGKVEPGGTWSGEKPLGLMLLSVGFLGFGLDYLFESAAFESPVDTFLGVVLLIMIACLPFGLVIEWKAGRARRRTRGRG
jgi:hypothetical protein